MEVIWSSVQLLIGNTTPCQIKLQERQVDYSQRFPLCFFDDLTFFLFHSRPDNFTQNFNWKSSRKTNKTGILDNQFSPNIHQEKPLIWPPP